MQSRSLAFLIIILFAIPVIALSSNHELFFVVMSLVVTVISIRYLIRLLTCESLQGAEADEELEEELEDLIDIDIKQFGKGLSISVNLLTILFLFYCALFLDTILLKALVSFAIVSQVYFIVKKTGKHSSLFSPDRFKLQILLSSLLNLAVILFTILNKLYKIQ